jgi:periplasmic copper chaperone A
MIAKLAIALVAVIIGGGNPSGLPVHSQPAVTVSDAWVPLPADGATSVALYATIENPTMYDVYVVSGTSDVAATVELRDGDKAVKDFTVASFGSLELKAGGPHVLLGGVKRTLKEGETIEVTLTTDGGLAIKAAAVVKAR